MAELTIHRWDKVTDVTGAAMALRDYCGIHIRDAKKTIEHCKNGASATVQVPFAKKLALAGYLHSKGFTTS